MSVGETAALDAVRYPIGRFAQPAAFGEAERRQWIGEIEAMPAQLRAAVAGLNAQQLDTPYREGGWSTRQIVHHLADSHLNAYLRFRLGLTQDEPTINAYDEKQWAELADAKAAPIETSLQLLDGLQARLTQLLRALAPSDFARAIRHPERGLLRLEQNLALYAWHGRHHTAQVTGLRRQRGW